MSEEEKDEKKVQKKSKVLIFSAIGVIFFLIITILLIVILLLRDQTPKHSNESTQEGMATKNASLLQVGPLYQFSSPFIVNLINPSGKTYLKSSITLELSNPKLNVEVEQKLPILQSRIIEVMSNKTTEEIATERGKERLKNEILVSLNQVLVDGTIKNVFFTEFILQ